MDPETTTPDTPTLTDRLAQATQSLADALSNLEGHFASLHAKIDRIVAAVDEGELQASSEDRTLHTKLAELEKANHDLKAQSAVARRKTLSPMITALLAKEGVEGDALIETPVVEKALAGLSIEHTLFPYTTLFRSTLFPSTS